MSSWAQVGPKQIWLGLAKSSWIHVGLQHWINTISN